MTGRSSTSSSLDYQWTYDVFINFRGEDTRHGFRGNLYNALSRKGIRTFFDDVEIRKGDEITPTLLKAIEESRMAITIFSKNYASSTFCLKELVKILQCIKGNGRLVWPIFYDVEPSNVRHQKGNYEEALAMHKKNFKANGEEMQRWKLALHEVANLSGSHFSLRHDQYEYQFIERIVNEISSKINRVPLHVAEYPVGLKSRVLAINSLLGLGSNDEVNMVGIYGIGGMGKTTIARAVYNSIADNFEGLCFLHDIKENSRKLGLEQMQERMLSKILEVDIKVEDVNEGVPIIKMRLKEKRILLILDNVDKREQLEKLAGDCNWFGFGSRIIITTRDKQLLERHGVERIYNMEAFNYKESLELLTWNAFRNNQVDLAYMKVLYRVIYYVQGLPLALEVIGSHLFGMSISEWESALDIYRKIPNEDIHQILKVSYDGLKEVEKETFLDIACFYRRWELEYVQKMVKHAHGFDPNSCIKVLMDKCLIEINVSDCIEMHDLIQDMGREIVRQESPKEPGKRSRLWFHEDITHVLEENTGTDEINIIIQHHSFEYIEVNWDGEAFKKIKNLKILIFENAKFSKGPKHLPNSLKVLKWPRYPSSCLPLDFCPRKLVVFELLHGCLNSLEPIKKSKNLSILNLRSCQYITQIPNLSGIPGLKELWLDSCKNLIEIHDSVGYLAKLETLSANECTQLRTFPRAIKLPSLKLLSLKRCSSLKYFPEILEKMEYITCLKLQRIGIEKLPLSICNLTGLRKLFIEDHEGEIEQQRLTRVEAKNCGKFKLSKYNPKRRNQEMEIRLIDCNTSDEVLLMYLSSFTTVKYLDLTANNFTILPACIKECRFLLELKLNYCKHLRDVQEMPPNLKSLEAVACISLSSESKNLILSQESLGAVFRKRNNISDKNLAILHMPGTKIPEWFDLCSRGRFISFWIRNKFPTVAVCVVLSTVYERRVAIKGIRIEGTIKLYSPTHMTIGVFINGKVFSVYSLHLKDASDDDHIIVYDLLRHPLYELKEPFRKREWDHVEVGIISLTDGMVARESGIYVIKQDCSMEDIRFTNPYDQESSSDDDVNSNYISSDGSSSDDDGNSDDVSSDESSSDDEVNSNYISSDESLSDDDVNSNYSSSDDAISNKAIIDPPASADGEPYVPNMKEKEPMLNKKRKLKEHAPRFPDSWSIKLPSKMVEIARKIMEQAITSMDIVKFHILHEIDCRFCGKTKESLNHIFIHCDFARSVWFASPLGLRIDEIQPQDICSWLRFCLWNNHTLPLQDVFFEKAVIITLHCIWEARNRLIYENLQPNPVATNHRIRAYLQSPLESTALCSEQGLESSKKIKTWML